MNALFASSRPFYLNFSFRFYFISIAADPHHHGRLVETGVPSFSLNEIRGSQFTIGSAFRLLNCSVWAGERRQGRLPSPTCNCVTCSLSHMRVSPGAKIIVTLRTADLCCSTEQLHFLFIFLVCFSSFTFFTLWCNRIFWNFYKASCKCRRGSIPTVHALHCYLDFILGRQTGKFVSTLNKMLNAVSSG